MQMPAHHHAVLDRFSLACQADARVRAAFLGGSYARGAADAYSDLDLYLITTDEAHAGFLAAREDFMRRLGEPVFLEDFGRPDNVFFIFADGAEGELGIGRESGFAHMHSGPHRVLVDKSGLLAGMMFSGPAAQPGGQIEVVRRQVVWFWHDLSHFISALGREQLWWAQGQLEGLRRCCVNLARLRQNLSDADVGEEAYFKLEHAVPAEALASLGETFCPMEPKAMLDAAFAIVRFYRELAPGLAEKHGLAYPADLERVMRDRLETLRAARLSRPETQI